MTRPKTIANDDLLARARRVFREKGHVASTREVARAVGLSESVLYQRFGSKDALFFAAMTAPPPDLVGLAGAESSGRDALRGMLARLVAYFADLAPTMLQVMSHPSFSPEKARAIHARMPAALLDCVAARVSELQRAGEIGRASSRGVALWLVAVAHSLAHLAHMTASHVETAHPTEELIAILWSGVAPKQAAAGAKARRTRAQRGSTPKVTR